MPRPTPETRIKRAREWNTKSDGPQTEDEIVEEMQKCGLVTQQRCPKHPDGAITKVAHHRAHCAEMRDGGRRCEVSLAPLSPYVSCQARRFTPAIKWEFWRLVALLVPVRAITYLLSVSCENLRAQFQELYDACDHFCQKFKKATAGMTKCQIDETYIGKRKYSQGRRVRRTGFWFMTATEVLNDGKSGRTIWKMVTNREKGTCTAFVQSVITGRRSHVTTDCWAGYVDLKDICVHKKVNHKHEFVNADGHHTNNAEGCHNVVKSRMRKVFHTYGAGDATVCQRVSLSTVLYNCGTPGARFEALLRALHFHNAEMAAGNEYTRSSDMLVDDLPDHLQARFPWRCTASSSEGSETESD